MFRGRSGAVAVAPGRRNEVQLSPTATFELVLLELFSVVLGVGGDAWLSFTATAGSVELMQHVGIRTRRQ